MNSGNANEGEAILNTDWMSQLPTELHSLPLFELALPGSHDSMSYDLDINSSIIEPDGLKKFSKIYCVRKIIKSWAITQEEPITKQLDAGARYFDLRIARKPKDPIPTRLYFYHGLYTRTDVETALRNINDWASMHPKEILILSFSHFEGFDSQIKGKLHDHLISFIKTLFGTKLVNTSSSLTLKSCWDQNKNVIVSYDYPTSQHPEIWGKIPYYYGDSMDPIKVESRLDQALQKERPSKWFFVCGLNLTLPGDSRALKYILRPFDNLPSVTHRSLPKLLEWLKQESRKTSVNIVASDLVTADNFVPTIIEFNMKHVLEQHVSF
ncbi:PI-PLC X domain-containing protein 1-like [Gouania willdenowi]|uniref:PI-PLC X domain-containing protein 1-like n=1 Tax=Gouania willdenowi TaxID=441366 RepID=A0A8C5HGJ4_GOUWI|nr:PI-PLC X domain-containing protein 1-like [Gouania willdenowi]XP_028331554.1 PI-PLC X domain-containing protein 1-like [Gouania willdenowi]